MRTNTDRLTVKFPRAVLSALWDTMGAQLKSRNAGPESTFAKAHKHFGECLGEQQGKTVSVPGHRDNWIYLLDVAAAWCSQAADPIRDALGVKPVDPNSLPEVVGAAADVRARRAAGEDV